MMIRIRNIRSSGWEAQNHDLGLAQNIIKQRPPVQAHTTKHKQLQPRPLMIASQSGVALYAEDFGQRAANRLDAYVRHQVGKE